ncbi:hypothetical protein CLV59_103128 [Chitinophaga dinghuensis]|uniref:Uncharacterized protein n=1 Tax=Chitinophaga dinghuensis TaxID=1539050 RepID=A0A327W1R0_9BACT|nr:hypothetical protein CLV59_103128 [Chitinophaga dinghuensis]
MDKGNISEVSPNVATSHTSSESSSTMDTHNMMSVDLGYEQNSQIMESLRVFARILLLVQMPEANNTKIVNLPLMPKKRAA